jgi:hypothetical protein
LLAFVVFLLLDDPLELFLAFWVFLLFALAVKQFFFGGFILCFCWVVPSCFSSTELCSVYTLSLDSAAISGCSQLQSLVSLVEQWETIFSLGADAVLLQAVPSPVCLSCS